MNRLDLDPPWHTAQRQAHSVAVVEPRVPQAQRRSRAPQPTEVEGLDLTPREVCCRSRDASHR